MGVATGTKMSKKSWGDNKKTDGETAFGALPTPSQMGDINT